MTRPVMVQSKTRLPIDLLNMLEAEANKNLRSKNAEIVKRLYESFYGKPKVRVKAATFNEFIE